MSQSGEPSAPKSPASLFAEFISFEDYESGEEQVQDAEEDGPDDPSTLDSEDDEDDDDDRGSSEDEPVPQQKIDELLEKARQSMRAKSKKAAVPLTLEQRGEEEVIALPPDNRPLPPLNPGPSLPAPYFSLPTTSDAAPPKLINDPGTSSLSSAASKKQNKRKLSPSPPPLTKRQRREMKDKTAGPAWFDLPAPTGDDLVKIKREMEANRLRSALDPKTFLRKEAQKEEVPKYVALGRIIPTKSPFTSGSSKNLTRAERKRTIVDELVADTEARAYAKRKFNDLQSVRDAKGKGTYRRKFKRKERKW